MKKLSSMSVCNIRREQSGGTLYEDGSDVLNTVFFVYRIEIMGCG